MRNGFAGASALALSLLASSAWAQTAAPSVVVPPSSVVKPTDAGKKAHTNYRYLALPPGAAPPALHGPNPQVPPGPGNFETPASLACVYGLVPKTLACNPNKVTANVVGGSRAIAIVDAFDNPTVRADLKAYAAQFGLPAITSSNFQVVFATGTRPPRDDGWGLEIALDVEMAHALAPKAKVILVEAASNSFADLLFAEKKAAALVAAAGGGEVSNSWGSNEFGGETGSTFTSPFTKAGVAFFASTGDAGFPSFPAVAPSVVAAGGTTINRTAAGDFVSEASWSEAGAGPSQFFARPAFQSKVAAVVGTHRGIADLAAVANPNTGVWVRFQSQWFVLGGTSVSSPLLAAIANTAGHFATSSAAEEARIYGALGTGAFRDEKTGVCGVNHALSAKAGYDFCTGVGSPVGKNGL
jgi:subtilase family serine protease